MPETIGQRLRYAREKRGLSQYRLEKVSGVFQASISRYELDQTMPSVFQLSCLADALNVSLDWLAGRTKYMEVRKW